MAGREVMQVAGLSTRWPEVGFWGEADRALSSPFSGRIRCAPYSNFSVTHPETAVTHFLLRRQEPGLNRLVALHESGQQSRVFVLSYGRGMHAVRT